ncbi:MAG: Rne/Rng family ribonuclease [Paludibacteraceae bacterium]|nr:Rne/Rng family ribonuclease [Paludibacteraceae bacterium]
MKSELIVDVQPEEIAIALTEDDRLMEVSREVRQKENFAVGNIYYGRVKKIMPALNAVFVDVGFEKEAFLHYLDLGSQFLTLEKFTNFAVSNPRKKANIEQTPVQPEVGKHGNVQDVCKVGQDILVQVIKEPINTKGPRLTGEISLAGRNMVLIPFGEKVMVSSKIRSEGEKSRLRQLVQVIKPAHFGVIVRTQAEGKRAAELDAEMKLLLRRWEETVTRLQKAKPVSLVTEEIGRTIGVIRDIFTPENFTAIYVNDQDMYTEVKQYVGMIAPEAEDIVHMYKSAEPIFDHFQVTRQMKTGLGRTVGFKSGGYLIMERTEALFSIDVNSGSKKLGTDQEDNAFRFNMLAADEIVHQLRLRDIGGIIIVDFIDMDSAEHRQLLFEYVRKQMKRDRARHNVLQLSKFGLMQITRQRVRPAVEMDVSEECPTCHGKGRIEPSLLFMEKLESECQRYSAQFGRGLTLRLHPYICAYVEKGLLWTSLKWQWLRKYGVRIASSEMLGMLEYRFLDKERQPLLIPVKAVLSADQKADAKAKIYATKPIQEKPEVVIPESKEDAKPAKSTAKEAASAPIAAEQAETNVQKSSRKRRKKKTATPSAETVATVAEQATEAVKPETKQAAEPPAKPAEEQAKPVRKRAARKKSQKAAEADKPAEQAKNEAPKPEAKPVEDTAKPVEEPAKSVKKRTSRKKTAKAEPKAANADAPATADTKPATAEPKPAAEPAKAPAKKRAPRKKAAKAEPAKPATEPAAKQASEPANAATANAATANAEPKQAKAPAKKRQPRKKTAKKAEPAPADSANQA